MNQLKWIPPSGFATVTLLLSLSLLWSHSKVLNATLDYRYELKVPLLGKNEKEIDETLKRYVMFGKKLPRSDESNVYLHVQDVIQRYEPAEEEDEINYTGLSSVTFFVTCSDVNLQCQTFSDKGCMITTLS